VSDQYSLSYAGYKQEHRQKTEWRDCDRTCWNPQFVNEVLPMGTTAPALDSGLFHGSRA
jgi:hypothetical protein